MVSSSYVGIFFQEFFRKDIPSEFHIEISWQVDIFAIAGLQNLKTL